MAKKDVKSEKGGQGAVRPQHMYREKGETKGLYDPKASKSTPKPF
jgi:hypothetical protein